MKYYEMFFNSITEISNKNIELNNNEISYGKVFGILEKEKTNEIEENEKIVNGDISFENLSFSYSEDTKDIFKNYNISINKGEKIAIIGKSGSGKSTFIKLLLGTIKPTSGRITVGKKDIKILKAKELMKKYGVVMQDTLLFNLSILDNLKLSKIELPKRK